MLHPFPATLLVPRDPAVSRAEAAAWSRTLRDVEGRYQSAVGVPPRAFRRTRQAHLYRYEVSSPRGLVYQGLVGEVRLADLLPHEATLGAWALKPTPPF